MKKLLFLSVLIAGLCLSALSASAAGRTTRDLVFEDDAPKKEAKAEAKTDQASGGTQSSNATQASQTSIAVKTTIMLTRDGKTSTVLPSHEFKSGDSVKLVFTPNVNGYVYWMSKGSSGNYAMLFPSAKSGMDNKVERNKEYTVPVKGSFKFDAKAGKEELLCILSEQKLPDLEKALNDGAKSDGDKSKVVASLTKENESKRTTRDLVFEDDDAGDVNTKKQTAAKGEPFVAHFVLTHK